MTLATFELNAEVRQDKGKGASRRLRRLADKVPAIMYGGGETPVTLAIDHNQLVTSLKNEAFYSHILTIDIAGKKQRAVLKSLQRHPVKPRILHMDLLRITGKEKITMRVPLHFKGAEVCMGVKEGGLVSHLISELEIRCLPDDLPEYIQVDISAMNLNDSLHLSDLVLPKGVEIAANIEKKGQNLPVVNIHLPRAAEEEIPTTAPEASTAEVPTIEKGKEKEGKEGAEVKEGKEPKGGK